MTELEKSIKKLLEVGNITVIYCGVCDNTKKRGTETCKACSKKNDIIIKNTIEFCK